MVSNFFPKYVITCTLRPLLGANGFSLVALNKWFPKGEDSEPVTEAIGIWEP